MKINPKHYAKQKKGGNAPIMVNVRLRRARVLGKPTAHDVRVALQKILDTGRVPGGWQFAAIDWRHTQSANADWRGPGDEVDVKKLGAVIQSELSAARIAIVRDVDGEGSAPPFKSTIQEEL